MAPIHRVARLAVIVSAIGGIVYPNSLATGARTKERRKKSNASNVQPRNPARIALVCPLLPGVSMDFAAVPTSVRAPFVRLGHGARDGQCGNHRHRAKHSC